MATATHDSENRGFDGIICIGGEDWWYHNRGHFDFQIMRRIARRMPVLFVNSLGVRMPHLGTSLTDSKQFAGKISRKQKSWSQGLVNVENNFWVLSPFSVPGAVGRSLSDWALSPQIERAAFQAGIVRPVLWVHCPAGAPLIDRIPHEAVVMQRTDRFEAFPEARGTNIAAHIATLKSRADLVVYCAPHLMAEEHASVRRQLLVTHGVDLETFVAAGDSAGPPPLDMAYLPRPRVGFVGGIDAHTFAPELYIDVARRIPDATFVLVGGCSLPEGWADAAPNIVMLGRKPYETVAQYMAAMDVLIMPWNDSEWIKACNPIKMKEYLAVGRPVVTTDFRALDGWRDLLTVASDAEGFAAAVRAGLSARHDPAPARQRVATETWDAKADLVVVTLDALTDRAKASAPMSLVA